MSDCISPAKVSRHGLSGCYNPYLLSTVIVDRSSLVSHGAVSQTCISHASPDDRMSLYPYHVANFEWSMGPAQQSPIGLGRCGISPVRFGTLFAVMRSSGVGGCKSLGTNTYYLEDVATLSYAVASRVILRICQWQMQDTFGCDSEPELPTIIFWLAVRWALGRVHIYPSCTG